jgi:ribonuclease-3
LYLLVGIFTGTIIGIIISVTVKKTVTSPSYIKLKQSGSSPKAGSAPIESHNDARQGAADILISKLSRKLGYQFSNTALLTEAITHRSKHSVNNERLEFLGDSVLGYVISSELFRCFPDASEGELTRGRAMLVKGETLAELALEIGLGDFLQLGPGELKSGGYRRKSILSDAMEAIIAAIYIDGGLERARQYILSIYTEKLNRFSLEKVSKDPKTQLQETMQATKSPLPIYDITATSGSDHEQNFEITCKVEGVDQLVKGFGGSRRKAEQDAAAKVLLILAENKKG